MKQDETVLSLVKRLQNLRSGVPTFVLMSGIHVKTVIDTRRALMGLPKGEEIDIILHSGGGSADDAYRLIRTFRSRYQTVNVIIPFWAKSAATIFAFGGSRIVLHEFGELGPLDAQIKKNDEDGIGAGYASALNVQSSLQQIENRARVGVIEMFKTVSNNTDIRISKKQLFEMLLAQSSHFYEPLLNKIDTMEIGSMARYLEIGAMYAKRILKQYSTATDASITELLDFLVYESPDHGYVVDYSILSQYLDTVILANEPPFSDDYYKQLDTLSLLLMQLEFDKVGFIDELIKITKPTQKPISANSKQKRDKIELDEKETKQDESSADSSPAGTQGTISKSPTSTSATKSGQNKPKR